MKDTGIGGVGVGIKSYEWAKFYLNSIIPTLQSTIRQDVTETFTNWMTTSRDSCITIGRFAFSQTAFSKMQANKPNLQFDGASSADGYYQRLSYYAADINKEQLNGSLFDFVKIDFLPLYQCMQVHDLLNVRSEFIDAYVNTRLVCKQTLFLIYYPHLSN